MSIDKQRHVNIHISGTNCSGKTVMAVAMMNALAGLGIENIKFINPEHTPDQIMVLGDLAPKVIAEKLTDVNVTFTELFGDKTRVVQGNAVDEVERTLKAVRHYIETPGDFNEEERLALIEDITGILPEEPQ